MSTISEQRVARPSRRPASAQPRPAGSFYRVVWRWHFYAGMLIAPVLLVVATTGALYIFREEIESLVYADSMYTAPADSRVSVDQQLEIARAAAGDGFKATNLYVPHEADRTPSVFVTNGEQYNLMHVDPYRGTALGSISSSGFFPIVLKIHRQLFVGTTGRIVVELTTCWTIVLVITGAYLWWPRKRGQVWGVWLPRIRGGWYRALRDVHAVSGIYVAAIALTIACTGLIYTYFWGKGYAYAAKETGAYSIYTDPPKSKSPADARPLPLDDVVRIAQQRMPEAELTLLLPKFEGAAHVIFASRPIGPSSDEVLVLDHASGEELMHRHNAEYPALGWWATWNYPLHVGSVLGLPTKILWLVACLALMAMPITGVWMWWQRRPKGSAGLPRKSEARVPRWLVMVICGLGLVLPALGMSLVAILVGEAAVRRFRAPRLAT